MATMATTPKNLTETFGADSSDVSYVAILKAGTNKYRVSLRRNSHAFQSHARVDVLHVSGWLTLIDLHNDEFVGDLHAPIAGSKITPAIRKAQMRELATNLVIDAHRVYMA